MNEEKREVLLTFINMYEKAGDKAAFIARWKEFLTAENEPLTKADAYDAAYGSALAQL